MVRERFAAHVRTACFFFFMTINAKKTSLFTFKKKLSLGDDVGSHDVVLVLCEAWLTWHCPCALDCHLPKNTKAPDKLIPRLMVIHKQQEPTSTAAGAKYPESREESMDITITLFHHKQRK